MKQTLGVRYVQKGTAGAEYLCTTCVQYLHKSEEASLGGGVTDGAEIDTLWVLESNPTAAQPALYTTELSVQHPSIILPDLFLPPQSGCLALP